LLQCNAGSGERPVTQAAVDNPNRLVAAVARRLQATGRKPVGNR
jgi:hypothetical protein